MSVKPNAAGQRLRWWGDVRHTPVPLPPAAAARPPKAKGPGRLGEGAKGVYKCAADFSLLNLPKGKSLGRSKPATNS